MRNSAGSGAGSNCDAGSGCNGGSDVVNYGNGSQSGGGEALMRGGQAGQVQFGSMWPTAQGTGQAPNGIGMQSQNSPLQRLPLDQGALVRLGSVPIESSFRDVGRDGRKGSGSPIPVGRRGSQLGGNSPISVGRRGNQQGGNSPLNRRGSQLGGNIPITVGGGGGQVGGDMSISRRGSQLGGDMPMNVGSVRGDYQVNRAGRFEDKSPIYSISSSSQGITELNGGLPEDRGGRVETADNRDLVLNGNSAAIYMQSTMPMEQGRRMSGTDESWHSSSGYTAETLPLATAVAGPNNTLSSMAKPRHGIVVKT